MHLHPFARALRARRFTPAACKPRATSARFRRPRLLVVGCGDVGMRLLRQQPGRGWLALTSSAARLSELRQAGARPLLGNLDQRESLQRLAAVAQRVVYMAPPAAAGVRDLRMRALLLRLAAGPRFGRCRPPIARPLAALAYVSTTGVYGDCGGAWVDERRLPNPRTDRARRRVDAEQRVRALARSETRASVLRAPGIYALDRPQGDPRQRVAKAEPVLQACGDVYTNHIHADDLARACWLALWRARPGRVYNANDDTSLKTGDYFDQLAQQLELPAPPRISRAQAEASFSPMRLSFLRESRRLRNVRIKKELGFSLRYPSVFEALRKG